MHGTPQWKAQRKAELIDMVEDIGLPTFFVTFSAADHNWPNLQRLCNEQGYRYNADIVDLDRNNNVNTNPALCDWYFTARFNLFVKFLQDKYGMKDHWFIAEWQMRASIHYHGCLWLPNAPFQNFQSIIASGTEEEKAELLRYIDSFISAWNEYSFTKDSLKVHLNEVVAGIISNPNPAFHIPPGKFF
jgi:hypothetical protein